MFDDDTNLFFNHKDIKPLYSCKQRACKHGKRTKYTFFHKPSRKDDIPPRLPKLIINNHEIEREQSIKFLGVLLDQQKRKIYQVSWGFIRPTLIMERTHKTY